MTRLLAARVLSLVALAITSLVMFGTAPAHACSCAPASVPEYAERADVVFVGTITTMESGPAGSNVVYGVEVDQVFKGDVSRETEVVTAGQSTACGLTNLPQAKPLIFFASPGAAGLRVNSCDGTGETLPTTMRAVTAALGEPREPSTVSDRHGSPDVTDDGDEDGAGMAPWLVGGGLLVAAAAGGGVLLRRRRSA